MDPLVAAIACFLACAATWCVKDCLAARRARRTRLDRLLDGYRLDLAIDQERAEARRRAALEEANLAWSGERRTVVVNLSAWRARRRGGAA